MMWTVHTITRKNLVYWKCTNSDCVYLHEYVQGKLQVKEESTHLHVPCGVVVEGQ